MSDTASIRVEVIYAMPDQQLLLQLTLDNGATIETAIRRSGVLERYPEIDLNRNRIGVFSQPAKLTQVLRDGDRVEIYRPLLADPKAERRKRAENTKVTRNAKGRREA